MKLKLISWILASVIITPLLVSCSKEQQEPVISTEHEQPERTLSLADLYQLMRADMAQSFEEVVKQDQLRSLDATTTAPSEIAMEITHSYQDELKSNYSSLYKQEYSKIMGSLTYDNDLPKLEDIISLNLPDEEKTRLVIALALTTEVHAAIGSNMFELKPDSLLSEGSFSDAEYRKRRAAIEQRYEDEKRDCNKILPAMQDHISTLTKKYQQSVGYTAQMDGYTVGSYWSATGAALGYKGGPIGMFIGGVGGGVVGFGVGYYKSYTNTTKMHHIDRTAAIVRTARDLNNCLDAAQARAWKSFRELCAGVVALPNTPSTEARVTDSIPKNTDKTSEAVGAALPPQRVATPTIPGGAPKE